MEPRDEAELAGIVADAAAAGRALCIKGGGTRQELGHPVEGASLSLRGVSGITLYEPGALTLVARAGTPLDEIEAALAAEGQRLPFEPMDHRLLFGTDGAPTIGGVVAANVSGPRRVQAGACRDSLIGVRFVDGSGAVLKNGGRVMKNVTGYDLVKLMAGSHGTLGVLTEVSFKLLPAPETAATLRIAGLGDAEAVAAMSAALGSPYDVTGAAHLPAGTGDGPLTLIRLEGFEKSIAYRSAALRDQLGRFGPVEIETDATEVAARWAGLRDARAVSGGAGDIWRISVKPGDGPAARAALGPETVSHFDWGGGLIWARVPEGQDVRAALAGIPGHATLVRASAATKARLGVFQPEAPPLARIAAGLRARFDPRGILNPGRMG
ncbi:glycolate oxidase subunit GlcE [Halovulum dunhuangense]|uniref:Glycolate oxidase subunit GlcE n=1 Tax=Halovulum dunhuangense TaxID=1505036 RepID=A0A849L015_9RHOB|nr:glycolate oxidase subunit GlcE [Halovulum dunhuangense]